MLGDGSLSSPQRAVLRVLERLYSRRGAAGSPRPVLGGPAAPVQLVGDGAHVRLELSQQLPNAGREPCPGRVTTANVS